MTTFAQRPDIQDMVKSALAATANRVNVGLEASRQLGTPYEESSKTASAEQGAEHVPTEMGEKLASALEYLADEQLKEAADPGSAENASPGVGPGQGANTLEVSESNRTEANIDAGQGGQAKDQIPTNPPMAKLPGQPATAANAMATDVDTTHPEQPEDPMGNATASNAAQKTAEALAQSNLDVLQKLAEGQDAPDKHHVRRAFLGNPVSSAIEAKKGDKLKAFGGAYVNRLKEGVKGMAAGGAAGAALGTAAAVAKGGKKGLSKGVGKALKKGLKGGGATGGVVGANVGGLAGDIKGNHGAKASELHAKHSKNKGSEKKASAEDLVASNLSVLQKIAEDAINPASISGGAATAQGADAPSGVSASEEGPEPPKPAPANTQAGLVGSNESAINYDKRDAKANMRADMAKLLNEPMHSKGGDQVLTRTLEHDGGAKIAAAQLTKTAAAKALLLKLAKEQASEKDAKAKKEKQSQMGGELSTPSGQSGFSAASSM